MRSFASSLAFLCALSVRAQDPSHVTAPARHEQTLENLKRFASTRLNGHANLSCVEAPSPGSTKTITMEFSDAAPRGTPTSIDTGNLIQDIFAVSSGADFHFDHSATLKGTMTAVYNYSFQINGKIRAGSIYADETSGAISRITFRGADAPAHLFCSANKR